jgi:signal transduction histidine kinase
MKAGRRGDLAFAAAFVSYTVFALGTLGLGIVGALASTNPELHQWLHTTGFANESIVDRLALGVASASHQPQSAVGLAIDYLFSAFTIGLALFLLRLRPRQRTARLLALGMIGSASIFNLTAYSVYESMLAGPAEVALNFLFLLIGTNAYLFALLTFPDGGLIPHWPRLPLTVFYAVLVAAIALIGVNVQSQHRQSVIIFFGLVVPVAGVLSQLYRQRQSQDDTRRQQARLLVWAMTPALALGLVVAGQGVSDVLFPQLQGRRLNQLPVTVFRIFQPVFTIIPVALVVGIARYRLWDVERLISRTLVYGALAAFVGAVYITVVIGVGNLVGSQGGNLFLSILATGIAAAAFTPLRSRFQRLANRMVYGQRSTPYEVLSELSERLAEAAGPDELMTRMAKVLAQGTRATGARVWLKVGAELRPAAAWPGTGPLPAALPLPGPDGTLPDIPGARTAVPVRHQGELLGALSIEKPPGEGLTEVEERLVLNLASQAGLVLRNQGLTAELLARLEDLQSSRQRIVAAGNEARKRLERNIHDGAQQQLVALMVRLNLAQRVAEQESPKLHQMLTDLKSDTSDALENLRNLARGIYPPLLASEGLVSALEAHVRKSSLPAEIQASGIGRYDEETEAAIYFCCLEALQNVAKSSGASQVVVRLGANQETLEFTVEDNGRGFDPSSVKRGSGLQNMIDRVEALGGRLAISSVPGEGTSVRGTVPARPLRPAQRVEASG